MSDVQHLKTQLFVIPCTRDEAQFYVALFHRHHGASVGARFSLAVIDESGRVRGVAMMGRPVARGFSSRTVLELTRMATDGCDNAPSALYGAARRVAREMGFHRIVTYIRSDEPGTSLKAAGWHPENLLVGRSWDTRSRPREDKTEIIGRVRWGVIFAKRPAAQWPKAMVLPPVGLLE